LCDFDHNYPGPPLYIASTDAGQCQLHMQGRANTRRAPCGAYRADAVHTAGPDWVIAAARTDLATADCRVAAVLINT